MAANGWQFGVFYELEGVGCPRVFCDRDIAIVDLFGGVPQHNVF